MWRDVILTVITALLVPLLLMLYKIVRGLAIFREFPPHLHVDKETIRYPTGMAPGKVEHLQDRHGTVTG